MRGKKVIIIGGSFGGIRAAWELCHRLSKNTKIIIFADKPTTTFRASFPRVIFESVSPRDLTLDLKENFRGTGIEFVCEKLISINQNANKIRTSKSSYSYDFLVLATGARHDYEALPGSYKYAKSICDPARILETRDAILNFEGGDVFAGVGGGYAPCDGPPMEVLFDLDHRMRKRGARNRAKLHYFTNKENLLPPGGPQIWKHLANLFRKRGIELHLEVELEKIDKKTLYFKGGKKRHFDLAVLIPPYRGIKVIGKSGLDNEKGFIPVDWNTMRADHSTNRNIYAVGDCAGLPGPKQAHLALLQATIAAEHIAWRINKKGSVRAYLPEFKCVMDMGGGRGLYMYSQWMSDGNVVEIREGCEPYLSKIRFEELFFEKRGDVGDLHLKMMK